VRLSSHPLTLFTVAATRSGSLSRCFDVGLWLFDSPFRSRSPLLIKGDLTQTSPSAPIVEHSGTADPGQGCVLAPIFVLTNWLGLDADQPAHTIRERCGGGGRQHAPSSKFSCLKLTSFHRPATSRQYLQPTIRVSTRLVLMPGSSHSLMRRLASFVASR
jgi:hypothetical protein